MKKRSSLPSQSEISRRITALVRISPWPARVLKIGGILVGVLFAAFLCLMAFSGELPGENAGENFTVLFAGVLMLFTPPVLLILLVAALLEKRDPPRAVLWVALAVLTGAAGLAFTGLSAVSLGDASPGIVVFLSIISPVVLLLSAPGVYYAARTYPDVVAVLQENRSDRVLSLIEGHGQIRLEELASVASVPVAEVDEIVDGLLNTGRLAGVVNSRRRLVFSTSYVDEKQRLLLELVRSQGRVRLEVLARTLAVPLEVLSDWIYQVIQRGQFSGYINWKEGWLYSAAAQKIGSASQCPNCGGKLTLAGADLIQCEHCGSEITADYRLSA